MCTQERSAAAPPVSFRARACLCRSLRSDDMCSSASHGHGHLASECFQQPADRQTRRALFSQSSLLVVLAAADTLPCCLVLPVQQKGHQKISVGAPNVQSACLHASLFELSMGKPTRTAKPRATCRCRSLQVLMRTIVVSIEISQASEDSTEENHRPSYLSHEDKKTERHLAVEMNLESAGRNHAVLAYRL